MSLQDKKVHKLLAKSFRMSWEDITGDPDAGGSNEHTKKDKAIELSRGVGRSNVQLVVLTPRGRLLHAVTGYVSAKELLWELEQALAAWKAVEDPEPGLDARRALLVRRQDTIHEAWRKAFDPTKGRGARQASWQARQSIHDREILREHPLVHAGTISTRMLTGGPGTHFGYRTGGAGEQAPAVRELRRKIGLPQVRETEEDKRVRERREAAGTSRPPVVPRRAPAARPSAPALRR